MKFYLFIVMLVLSSHQTNGQVVDNFTDGDFISNPVWSGTTSQFTVNASKQLQLNNTVAGSSYLSTPFVTNSLNGFEWQAYVKQTFAPSSSNYGRIYLVSNQQNLNGQLNGYYLQFGEAGSNDAIELFRQTGNVSSSICRATAGKIATSFEVRVRVTRDNAGTWKIYSDYTGGTNFILEATGSDVTYLTSQSFGIACVYTASNATKFFFDDFLAGPIQVDTTPPSVTSVTVSSANQLSVLFSEKLDQTSAETISNYVVDNGIGNPTQAKLQSDGKTVVLLFNAFANGYQNQLTVVGIRDLVGNVITSANFTFIYFNPVSEKIYDVIVSEILPDPDPIIGLPAAEFVEIYNRSSNPFDLNGWKLTDGSSTTTFQSQIILPNTYWIVTSSTNASLFSAYQNVIGIANFPSLNNSGDLVLLKSSSGLTIDSLNYSTSWYRDADKQQGGWSLEKIDLNKSSTDALNWVASQDATGGTPGKQNSWFGKNPDVTPPKLVSLTVKNDSQLELVFDEPLDANSIINSNFNVNNSIGNPNSAQLLTDSKTVSLSFNTKFLNGVTNQLTFSNIADVAGNKIVSITSTFFYLNRIQANRNDLVISEILPDPDPVIGLPAAEFVEIYNRSSIPFDLNGWKLTDGSSTATFSSQIILPNSYWIVTSSTNVSLFSAYQNVISVANFPSLNNSGDLVLLKSSSGVTIDSLNYSTSWYRDADKQQGGWSLEKIDLNKSSIDPLNWVASLDVTGGTPGKQNSWFGKNPDVTPPKLISLTVKSDSQLELVFDEALDATSIINSNFNVNNSIGNPDSSQLSTDSKTVSLSFNTKFLNGVTNQLTISNITDAVGNKILPITPSFFYIKQIAASRNEIVISEILPDPDPVIGLPAAEFVEIYNRSSNPFDLNGWKLTDGSSTANFSSQIILPNTYWIVTSSTNASLFSTYQNVMGVANFPSLNNSGDLVLLKSSAGLTVDSLNYSTSWYRDVDKQQGGWSLEKIDLNKSSTDPLNWVASQDVTGGTPGKQNSWFGKNPDVTPPKLISLNVKSDSQLELVFDEPLDPSSITNSNFIVENNIGNPSSVQLSAEQKVIVINFNTSFPNGITSQITISNVTDLAGNRINPIITNFTFIIPNPSFHKDVVITEIMADPTPSIGLPNAEFVEIFNRNKNPFDLGGWVFQAGVSTCILPHKIILPQQYVILTNSKSALPLEAYGTVISSIDFPVLNNDGESIQLKNTFLQTIDSVNYSTTWYRDNDKAEGGWSLELIDVNNPCGEEDNWAASESLVGGTPGKQNSVFANKPDVFGPKLEGIVPIGENSIVLSFDKKLDPSATKKSNYNLTPSIDISLISFVDNSKRKLKIDLQSPLLHRQLYSLEAVNVYDCSGNNIQQGYNHFTFALSENAEASDILINEILFNPKPGGVDFLEIFNNSNKYISLANCKLANIENGVLKNVQPIQTTKLLEPKQYRVFTVDPAVLKNNYPQSEENNFVKTTLPSLPDDVGSVAIVTQMGAVIDSFLYDKKMHSSLIKNDEGVSLERISLTAITNDGNNWRSASSQAGFATPGYANSNLRLTENLLSEKIKINPEIIFPDAGQQDFASIQYSFDQNDLVGNIKVLDQQGRLVKSIANNETLGYSGFFRWDGNTQDGNKARMGYYIIWIELFDDSGAVQTFRKRIIVAGR